MAPNSTDKDPRMKDVKSALQKVASLDGQANNFQTRGKVALSETKTADAGIAKAEKMVAGLMKGGSAVNKSMKRLLEEYKKLKNTGEFGVFAAQLKKENATLNAVASLAKQYTTLLADGQIHNQLKRESISYEGMFQYCNQFVTIYISFAKDFNTISKFKDDGTSSTADPKLASVQESLTVGAKLEGMCDNFQSRGKVALKELKTAKKSSKDKAVNKDYDATTAAVEALVKSAGQASAEYKAMLKDYAAAKKDGDFSACAVKIKSRAPAFRTVQQHAADLAKKLESVSFDHKSTSLHPGIVGLLNYRKMFDDYHKSFKSALG
ncbi:MAG: hypothetical protein WD046_02015 [Paracoccaceae bacterium]